MLVVCRWKAFAGDPLAGRVGLFPEEPRLAAAFHFERNLGVPRSFVGGIVTFSSASVFYRLSGRAVLLAGTFREGCDGSFRRLERLDGTVSDGLSGADSRNLRKSPETPAERGCVVLFCSRDAASWKGFDDADCIGYACEDSFGRLE